MPLNIKPGKIIFVKFYKGYQIPGVNRKFNSQRKKFFKILKKYGPNIYKLELLLIQKIWLIINIIILESALIKPDLYKRFKNNNILPLVLNNNNRFINLEIEK